MIKQCLDQWLLTCGALKNTDAQIPLQTNESTVSEGGAQASVFFKGSQSVLLQSQDWEPWPRWMSGALETLSL